MCTIVPEEKFQKKLKRKEFNALYYSFIAREPCVFNVYSLEKICTENKTKIVEYLCASIGYMDNRIVPLDYFLDSNRYMEWDYEFIKSDVLRVSITSSYWFDVYLSEYITEEKQEEYENLLEVDIMRNYGISDNYAFSRKMILDKLADMQDEYHSLYGENLQPDFGYE